VSNVLVTMGDVFEGAAHVTVLPCSGKGTVSSAVRRWLVIFDIPSPKDILSQPQFGDISELLPFKGEKSITKYVVFAASVLNDFSSFDIIFGIAAKLGELTNTGLDVRYIETPLLGTGAGGLKAEVAGEALYRGFQSTAHQNSTLNIFVFDRDRQTRLQTLFDNLEETEVARSEPNLSGKSALLDEGNEGTIIETNSKDSHDTKVRLAQFIATYFDKEDFENLCYDLGIDHENLRGEKKGTRARNLVNFMEGNGRLIDLQSKLANERSIPYKQTFGD